MFPPKSKDTRGKGVTSPFGPAAPDAGMPPSLTANPFATKTKKGGAKGKPKMSPKPKPKTKTKAKGKNPFAGY